jgi:hypothetical protein
MIVPHYTYLVLKMLGPNGIITVKGSFELSDLCHKEFHKMAQNFSMMASYGEPNYKEKKRNYRSHTTTRRTPNRARSEETMGTDVRPRETYKRRREDPGDKGDKNNKKVE